MRDEHEKFIQRGTEILAIGPDSREQFIRYWANEKIPYTGLPDSDHKVARMYRQEVNLFKLGRMPMVSVVDIHGQLRYVHYGALMSDIPSNEILFGVIDELNTASIPA
jgi:peroxiredoxin Q/BCP